MGEENAERMLGMEGWTPTAQQALDVGFVQWTAPSNELLGRAQAICEGWISEKAERTYRAGATREELKSINARESVELADCFLAAPFLLGQFRFLWGKKKRGPAMMFGSLWATRPLWSRLLP